MKFSPFILLAVFAITFSAACSNSTQDYSKEAELGSLVDSASYVIGFQSGLRLSTQGFSDVHMDQFVAGFKSGLDGDDSKIADAELQALFTRFNEFMLDKMKTENKLEGDAFLSENKTEEGVQVTDSGLQYRQLREGEGPSPTPDDTVVVMYEGRFIDGTIFDSTYGDGVPATLRLGDFIPGFIEGIQLMNVGASYELVIPSDLAYGEFGGPGGSIEPNTTLIFKVELIDFR